MSVEQIIDRVPEPRAVQDLVAAARTLEAERDALLDLLREVMSEGVEYEAKNYAVVQMGHALRAAIQERVDEARKQP